MLDVTRELYNAALQERRDAYSLRRISISAKMQCSELTLLRKPDHWLDSRLSAVYRETEDATLHRLDLAMQAFFRRCKRGEMPGFPRFKPAARWKQLTFPHGDRAVRFDAGQQRMTIPGVGRVKLRKGRTVPPYGRAWLIERNTRWYACFECERAVQPLPTTGVILGVDRGVHVYAATSAGELIRGVGDGAKRREKTVRLQRELDGATVKDALGRCLNRRDPRRVRAALRLARAKERESNARRDHAHKVARRLIKGADVIAIEALQLRNMTRSAKGTRERPGCNIAAKSALNRVILDAGFGLLERMIVAKAEEAARSVVRVDPRFSSQTCAKCGHRERENRRRRRFECRQCGFSTHADIAAALEIRRRAQLALQGGPPDHPGEPDPAENAGRRRARRAA